MKNLANRVKKIDSSEIRKYFLLASKVKNAIDLTIGQPDFDVPKEIKNAACSNIEAGFNFYTPTNGLPELIEKVSRKLRSKNKIGVGNDQIMITSGTTGGIFLAFMTLANPGDEIVLFDPYFIVYYQLAKMVGAKIKMVDTYPDFQPNIRSLEKAVSKKTKLIVINSPNNPTGAVYGKDVIKEIVRIARKNQSYILSDEVYEDFSYDKKNFSPGSIYNLTLTLGGFSKSYSMTGWRIGYAAGPKEVIDQMTKLQQLSFVCAPSFAQKAAIAALDFDNSTAISKYKKKRDIVWNGLKKKYNFSKPKGAFYLFLRSPYSITKFINDLIKKNVIVIPGNMFSTKKGYFRISYAKPDSDLVKAVSVLNKLTER